MNVWVSNTHRRIISPKIPNYANGKRFTRVEKGNFIVFRQGKSIDFNGIPGWIRNSKKENCSVENPYLRSIGTSLFLREFYSSYSLQSRLVIARILKV